MLKHLKKIIIALIIIAIVFGIYQFRFAPQKTIKDTFTVKRGTLKKELSISGEIAAEEQATLRFQTSGRLSWVGVKVGDYVKKYQGIASLDKRELEKNLKKELLDYMNERWDYDQTQDDYRNKDFTDAVKRIKEKAQFDLDNTVLDVEIKDLALQYATLISPIEGLVVKVDTPHAGVNITPAGAEFVIVNPKTVYFSALADQSEVVSLFPGLTGELSLDSYPDEVFHGGIKNISFAPKSGETGTVYEVKFTFTQDNSDYKYKLGMTGDVTFATARKDNVLHIPLKYLKTENGKKYVSILEKDNSGKKTYIETGFETDDDIEVVSGLPEGSKIHD